MSDVSVYIQHSHSVQCSTQQSTVQQSTVNRLELSELHQNVCRQCTNNYNNTLVFIHLSTQHNPTLPLLQRTQGDLFVRLPQHAMRCRGMFLPVRLRQQKLHSLHGRQRDRQRLRTAVLVGPRLGQVLLVVVFRVIKQSTVGVDDFRGDCFPGPRQRFLVRDFGLARNLLLCGRGGVDARSVLRASIVPLPHSLRRVVGLPKLPKNVPKRNFRRVPHDLHHFIVPGTTGTHFLVRGVFSNAVAIPHTGGFDARQPPKTFFGPPKTTRAEDAGLKMVGKGWDGIVL